MPTAFVTGATGFLGQHLVLQLKEQGWTVRALRRAGSPAGTLESAGVEWMTGDITDAAAVHDAIRERCDVVFHLAADTSMWWGDRERQTRINIDGTRNLLEAWESRSGGCFVHTSTIGVWGLREGDVNESTPRHEPSVRRINYARTKSLAESLVRETASRGRRAVILNPAHVMGPLDRHNWIRLIEMVAGNRLPAIASGSGSFADVREVARAHLTAVERARPGVNYLLGGENHSFAEAIDTIADRLGVAVRAPRLPAPALRGIARVKDWSSRVTGRRPDITPDEAAFVTLRQRCDSTRAMDELGYRITPFPVLVDDTVEWARSAGRL